MRKILFYSVFILVIMTTACTHKFKLHDSSDGLTLTGTYNTATNNVNVVIRSGEKLEGKYVSYANTAITHNSLFYGTEVVTKYRVAVSGGASVGYAVLLGDRGTVMEIIYQFDKVTGHGFGTAKSNDGKEYRVIF